MSNNFVKEATGFIEGEYKVRVFLEYFTIKV